MSNKYLNKNILIAVIFAFIFSFTFINAQENNIKAFPGAEGFGAYAKGGRGGAVCKVTNLNDSGSGSLRYCLEDQSGPRIVFFNVSGTIELNSRIFMSGENDSYVTVAGQTAPGNGIQLENYGIGILGGAHDVGIRYIKIRRGGELLLSSWPVIDDQELAMMKGDLRPQMVLILMLDCSNW